jgi:hypothetical protein
MGVICGFVIAVASDLQPVWGVPVYAAIVAAATGALVGPSVRGADRVMLVLLGIVAGGVSLAVGGLVSGFGGFLEALSAGRIDITDVPAVIAGLLITPILYPLFGAPLLLVLAPAGIAWAGITAGLWRARRR